MLENLVDGFNIEPPTISTQIHLLSNDVPGVENNTSGLKMSENLLNKLRSQE